jgi:hypothetical protein
MRALRLAVASFPLVAAFTVVGGATRVGPATVGCVNAAAPHHVSLVIKHSGTYESGASLSFCVGFAENQITGEDVLQRSGVQFATAPYAGSGDAVCQIDSEPATYPPGCWTASSPYWAMFVSRGGGSWQSSSLGISSQTFRDGDAEGFRYESQSDSSTPPSPARVCPPPATASPVAVAAPPNRPSASNPAVRTAAPSTPPPVATSATGATPQPAVSGVASVGATGGAVAGVATGPAPPSRPGSVGAGVWAASALAVALGGGVVFQVVRLRRRPPSRARP